MRKIVQAILLVCLACAVPLAAQIPSGYVQATATVPSLANGTYGAAWTNLSSSPQLALLGCVSTFQQTVNGNFDANGHFSVLLADTAQICPSPSTWTFTLTYSCPKPPNTAFMVQVPVTGGGATEDISAQIIAALPASPCGGATPTFPITIPEGGTGATTVLGANGSLGIPGPVFNIADPFTYGAVPDSGGLGNCTGQDNTAAIQAAINAAGAAQGEVFFPAGVWDIKSPLTDYWGVSPLFKGESYQSSAVEYCGTSPVTQGMLTVASSAPATPCTSNSCDLTTGQPPDSILHFVMEDLTLIANHNVPDNLDILKGVWFSTKNTLMMGAADANYFLMFTQQGQMDRPMSLWNAFNNIGFSAPQTANAFVTNVYSAPGDTVNNITINTPIFMGLTNCALVIQNGGSLIFNTPQFSGNACNLDLVSAANEQFNGGLFEEGGGAGINTLGVGTEGIQISNVDIASPMTIAGGATAITGGTETLPITIESTARGTVFSGMNVGSNGSNITDNSPDTQYHALIDSSNGLLVKNFPADKITSSYSLSFGAGPFTEAERLQGTYQSDSGATVNLDPGILYEQTGFWSANFCGTWENVSTGYYNVPGCYEFTTGSPTLTLSDSKVVTVSAANSGRFTFTVSGSQSVVFTGSIDFNPVGTKGANSIDHYFNTQVSAPGFDINGTPFSASNLSNGVSGTGAVCLASGSACAGSGTFNALTGDATSTSTGGATEVVGLLNHILPSLTTGYLNWTGSAWALSSVSGSGTVTNFSAGALSPLFTTSVATSTSTPALTFALTNAAQNSVFAGPASGGAGAPSYQTAPTIAVTNMTGTGGFNISGNAATATLATGATNVAGGVANDIPYQTGVGATSFIAPVNSAVLVTSVGGVPSESTTLPSGLTIPGYLTSSGVSGMTSGQVAIAASATTITSSEALAGSGAGITTGPVSGTTANHFVTENGTNGQIKDSGVLITAIPAADIAAGALANGMTATTQTVGDNTTDVATDAFVLANAGSGCANALTMNNSGSGASSGTTFNCGTAQTLSYNTLGAAPALGNNVGETSSFTIAVNTVHRFTGSGAATATTPASVTTGFISAIQNAGTASVTVATGGPTLHCEPSSCVIQQGGSASITVDTNGTDFDEIASNALGSAFGSLANLSTINNSNWSGTVLAAGNGGTGVGNTATLTLGTSNQNWATLGTGIVKNTTTTGAISDAASADVIALWSGTCSSSTYLNGAGACGTPTGFANPMTTLGDVTYGGASGVATRLAGPTSGAGTYFVIDVPTTTSAVAETFSVAATGTGAPVLATSPSIASLTVTSAFTATGLVTNADLANSATTINGQTCTLGSPCTIPLSAINPQTATYQVLAADFSNYKTITVASGTFTITLVASGTQPANGQYIHIVNYGSGVVTIARSGQNINGGVTSLSLAAGSATAPTSSMIESDGTNYFASVGGGSSGGTPAYPLTISGGVSGGVVYGSSSTQLTVSPAGTTNVLMKWGGAATAPQNSSITDNGTTIASAEPVVLGTANCTTFSTAGGLCMTEGNNITNVSGTTAMDANSTSHEIAVATNGSTSYGLLVRAQPGAIRSTGLVAAVTTATLCAASAGACNVAGTYHVHVALYQSGSACTANTTGGVSPSISWTDGNGTAHSAIGIPLQSDGVVNALTGTMLWGATTVTGIASGDYNIDTNGTVIQYAIAFAQCNTGTATYAASLVVTRLQ